MKLNYKQSLFKAILLVLSMMFMIAWASYAIIADMGVGEYSLVIKFDPDDVQACKITYENPSNNEEIVVLMIESGKTYSIPHGANLEGTITPASGKTAIKFSTTDVVKYPLISDNTFAWTQFNAPATVEIVCVNSTYKVVALDYDRNGAPSYNTTPDKEDHLQKLVSGALTYTFGGEPIELPVVSMTAHVFKGWYIISGSDPLTDITEVRKSADGKYYLNDSCIVESNVFFANEGSIQLYPLMEPERFTVYRDDYFYNGLGSGNHVPLYTYSQAAQVYHSISPLHTSQVIWGDDTVDEDGTVTYKTYPGFVLYYPSATDEYADEYKEKSVVIPRPDDPYGNKTGNNRVKRYYIPIEIALSFVNSITGEPLTAPGLPGTYTYATATDIPNPSQSGYTFTGWKVETWNGTAWTVVETIADDYVYDGDGNIVKFVLGNGKITPGNNSTGTPLIDTNSKYLSTATSENKIRFTALWKANEYNITYDWNVTDPALKAELDALNSMLTTESGKFTFADLSPEGLMLMPIGAAQRPGYTFTGWSLTYKTDTGAWSDISVDLEMNADGTAWMLPTNLYTSEVRLSAKAWEPETYDVILDPGADATLENYGKLEVRYDSKLLIASPALLIPTRDGYTFLGYFSTSDDSSTVGVKYINADGTPVDTLWKLDDAGTGSVTLYARWAINDYNISFDSNGAFPDGTVINVVTGIEIDGSTDHTLALGEILSMPYNTPFTVSILSPTGYKLVSFNGTAVKHTANYQINLTVDAKDTVFVLTALPERIMVLPKVHYGDECFKDLAPGSYLISWDEGGETKTQTVTIREPGEKLDIPDFWFGKELTFIYLGDGITTSDSEPEKLTPAKRPDAPTILGTTGVTDPEILTIYADENMLRVDMVKDILDLYEFAISKYMGIDPDPDTLIWQSSPEFTKCINAEGEEEPLYPGTAYHIFVRKKATDDAPCGLHYTRLVLTATADYITNVKDQLDDILEELAGDDAGEFSKELIENAKEQIDQWAKDLGAGDNFYLKVENLIQTIREKELAIALAKDRAIAELRAFRDSRVNSGAFSEVAVGKLNEYCEEAVNAIKNLTDCTETDIQNIYNTAINKMRTVTINTLTAEDGDTTITVESEKGLYQDSRLTFAEETEFSKLIQDIDKAIRTQGMVMAGHMPISEAESILRSLDVFASYHLGITHKEEIDDKDVFKVRLKLTDDLKNVTGLCVAYYNKDTGTIELLDSSVEGDYIVFTADRIADFVILGDPTLHLEGVILALGAVMFCQLLAIIVVLATRNKAKKQVKHCSVALPVMALAVHFSPVNGEVIALIMACATVLLQIILMALLISSGMIRLPGKKKGIDNAEELASDAEEHFADDLYAVPPQKEQEYAEEEEAENADDDLTVGAYAVLEFDGEEETVTEEDPFALYEESVEDDSEAFIEPAVATRYSLPDEDENDADASEEIYEDETSAYDGEEYAEEAGEEVYTEDTYDEEAYAEESYSDEDDYSDLYAAVPDEEPIFEDEDLYAAEDPVTEDGSDENPIIDDDDEDTIYRYDE